MAINFLNTVAVDESVLFVDTINDRVGVGTSTPGSVLDVQGTQGQLFSVTDDLSGEIFAVSDISGVPIMTVNSSGVSYFDGNVGIGTTNTSEKLTVAGNVESQDTIILNYNDAGNKWQQLFDGSNGWNLRYYNSTTQAWSSNYVNVNTSGNATFAGNVTLTSGALSISGDGSNAATLTESSAGILTIAAVDDIILDAEGDIALDANGGDIRLRDGGTTFGTFTKSGNNFHITSNREDGYIKFFGNDGGTSVTALTLNMADGGDATFSGSVTSPTFLGDLNGTINTATTGTTQTAGNNSTLIATTAYADAAAAAVPIGDYLPLAGGTMTGNLFIEGASTPKITITDTTNNLEGRIRVGNSYMHIEADTPDTVGSTRIIFRTDGVEALYLDGNQNATFAGTIAVQGTGDSYFQGNVGIGTTTPGEKLDVDGNVKIKDVLLSNQVNTDIDSAAAEVVAQVAHATYTAAFFDFVVKKGTNVRSGTVYACHNGDTTPLVEFTETSTNDLGDTSDVTLSVDISGTNMRLLATVTSDDWSVKSLIRAI